MLKLEYNKNLKRLIRMDGIDSMGVSTFTMLESLIAENKVDEADTLADYYHKELRIMHDILMTWGQDIIRFIRLLPEFKSKFIDMLRFKVKLKINDYVEYKEI